MNSIVMRHFRQRSLQACALLLMLSLSACAAGIGRQDLLKRMQDAIPTVIVDVRSQGEYDRGHLPGAVHVPFYAVASGLEVLAISRQEPVVLYCEHGPRAAIAGFLLHLSGYDTVYSLEGHMKGWRQDQFPVETISH